MGKRCMHLSPELLIEFLKQREDWPRAYTVTRALPDDTRLVSCEVPLWNPDAGKPVITTWLASDAWEGDGGELDSPLVSIHLLDPVALEAATRR